MSNNFEALIRARLDTSGIDAQIRNEIENRLISFDNIRVSVDETYLRNSIEHALSRPFNINVNPIINNRGLNNLGRNAAQQILGGINSSVNTGITDAASDVLRNFLRTLNGLNDEAIGRTMEHVTRSIQTANIQIRSMSETFQSASDSANGLRNFRIDGVDEAGQLVRIMTQLDADGNVARMTTRLTQRFNEITAGSQEVSEAFNRLLQIQKQVESIDLTSLRLDPVKNEGEIQALQTLLRGLREEYNNLFAEFGTHFSEDQLGQIANRAELATEKVSQLRDRLIGKTNDSHTAIKLDLKLEAFDAEIAKVERRLRELQQTGHSKLVDVSSEVADLKRLRTEMETKVGSALSDSYREFNQTLEKAKNNLTIVASETKSVRKEVTSLDVITLRNKMKTWLDKNSKATKDFGGRIEYLDQQLSNLDLSADDASIQLKKLESDFKSIQQEAIAAGKAGTSFGDKLKKALGGLAGFFTFETVFDKVIEALQDMYRQVYDIDSAMVNLRKVTDETAPRYERFLSGAAKSAKELGRSISSLVEQTADWAKLGYTLDQSEELAKLSSIYSNVAEVDDATAVSDMVTAMKAFNLETKDAVRIVDSLNILGNKFATDAASLGQGLSNSASALSVAGNDLYQTLAMITGITEITQDASGAGNALKISSMRIRGMKGSLEELGEEVDETVDSISKVQTQILNLTGGKVNIFDESGEFRNYYTIMKEIADVYHTLTSTDQASLSEILFGKNRGNQGAALIQSFQSGQIEKAYQTALDSAGSAAEEQDRWLQGLEAKVEQFKATWQELSMTVLDSDFLKGMVDAGTTVVEILTKIIDLVGLFPTILGGAGITAFIKSLDYAKACLFS